jgi:hypothetical protein
MAYRTLTFKGVRILYDGPLDHPDLQSNLARVVTGRNQLNSIYGEEGDGSINRDSWSVSRFGGVESLKLKLPYSHLPSPAKPKPVRKDPAVRYFPAFYTYDEEKNFIGLTVCMKEKWGPPYRFIKCKLEDVHLFEDGLWNYEHTIGEDDNGDITTGGVKPSEDYYKEWRIKSFIYSGVEDKWYDIPALHNWCAGSRSDNDYSTNGSESVQYPPDMITPFCDDFLDYSAKFLRVFYGTVSSNYIVNDKDKIFIYTSFPSDVSGLPVINYPTEGCYFERNISGIGKYGGYKTTWSFSSAPICSYYSPIVIEGSSYVASYANMLNLYRPENPNAFNYLFTGFLKEYSYNHYYEVRDIWSTFINVDINKGVFFLFEFINTIYSLDTTDSDLTAWEPVKTNTSSYTDISNAIDSIVVFNKTYKLKEGEWNTYYNDGESFEITNPRIYEIKKDEKVVLASLLRRNHKKYEYMCFWNDIEQYNDKSVMFDVFEYSYWRDELYNYFKEAWHEMPIEVNNNRVIGNGKFSLLQLNTISLPWPDPSVINDREDTDYIKFIDTLGDLDES